jgi:hypothetical protein
VSKKKKKSHRIFVSKMIETYGRNRRKGVGILTRGVRFILLPLMRESERGRVETKEAEKRKKKKKLFLTCDTKKRQNQAYHTRTRRRAHIVTNTINRGEWWASGYFPWGYHRWRVRPKQRKEEGNPKVNGHDSKKKSPVNKFVPYH